jgi:carbonic anhydrase
MIHGRGRVALALAALLVATTAGATDYSLPETATPKPAPATASASVAAPVKPHGVAKAAPKPAAHARAKANAHTAAPVAAPASVSVAAPAIPVSEHAAPAAASAHAAAATLSPDAVLDALAEGNRRFAGGTPRVRELAHERATLVAGQHPRAVVVACADSRVAPELVFDQTLGEVFVVRTAGNVMDPVAIGSVEYAVEHLHAPLVLVMGHEKCGAVIAAMQGGEVASPNLAAILDRIRPAIQKPLQCFSGDEALEHCVEANLAQSAQDLLTRSAVLREHVRDGRVRVATGVYHLASGEMAVLDRAVEPLAQAAVPALPLPVPTAIAQQKPAGPAMAGLDDAAPTLAVVAPRPAPAPAAAALTGPSISWEGQLRYRYEARSVLDYRVPGQFKRSSSQSLGDNGDQSLMRTRVGASVKLAPGAKGYFVMQDARVMGSEGSPGGTLQNVDLFQAYVDLDSLGGRPLALRAGRQVFTYGDARVVSGADWGNAGRGWDGARVRWAPKGWQVDGLVSWINEGRVAGADRLFSGVDALWKPVKTFELEGYSFQRSFGDTGFVAEGGRKGGLYDATTGLRSRWARGRLELKGEGAVQRGHRAGDDVSAWFGAGRASMELPGAWKPRATVEHIVSSGDRDPSDGHIDRYDPVYWGGHGFQGVLDVVGCSNVRDWSGLLALSPRKTWGVNGEYHVFRLVQARDYWIDDAGTTLRRSNAGAAGTQLGSELDLSFRWEPRAKVNVTTGWSHFFAGDYVTRTGGGVDQDWGYLQMAVGF